MDHALQLPVKPYDTGAYRRFGQRLRRRILLWATHLGDDVVASAGTPVQAIGDGVVVWSEMRHGSPQKRDWGGVIIIRHQSPYSATVRPRAHGRGEATRGRPVTSHQSRTTHYSLLTTHFYSIYGHLTELGIQKGDTVQAGQQLGVVAAGNTPENGWWQQPHLHFAIYTGPWHDRILPGYARPDDWLRPGATRRTRLAWWHDPREFIRAYNLATSGNQKE